MELGQTIIFTSENCKKSTLEIWEKNNVLIKIVSINFKTNLLDLNEIMKELYKLNIISLLIEGGSNIFTNFINNDLWDEIIHYQAPCLIGNNGVSMFNDKLGNSIESKINLKLKSTQKVGLCIENIYIKN